MRIYNRFILSLLLAATLITTILSFFGQNDLILYFLVITIVYLVIALFYVYFNPRARRILNTISAVFFGCFLVIIAIKVLEIVSGG